jgi:hypothetical protein
VKLQKHTSGLLQISAALSQREQLTVPGLRHGWLSHPPNNPEQIFCLLMLSNDKSIFLILLEVLVLLETSFQSKQNNSLPLIILLHFTNDNFKSASIH